MSKSKEQFDRIQAKKRQELGFLGFLDELDLGILRAVGETPERAIYVIADQFETQRSRRAIYNRVRRLEKLGFLKCVKGPKRSIETETDLHGFRVVCSLSPAAEMLYTDGSFQSRLTEGSN